MVHSNIIHPNIQLTDITSKFFDAVKHLKSGELVKDEHFTLFEAVGALEIGDAKMDSGCLESGEDMEDNTDLLEPITEAQAVWLMDELLCREAAWHKGYPLSQTLFTSLHVDRLLWPDPKTLSAAQFGGQDRIVLTPLHDIVRSYCLGLTKCVGLVLHVVTGQHFYEEEDFGTQLFNREMLQRFSVDEILDTIRRSMDEYEAQAEATALKAALMQRMQYRYALLQLLQTNVSGNTYLRVQLEEHLTFLKAIRRSSAIGEACPNAFSTKIQRRLASSVPPRPMVVLDRENAFGFFEQFLNDAYNCFEVFRVTCSEDLFSGFWIFMSQTPQPSVYIRALMQSFLSLDNRVLGRYFLKDYIIDDMKALVLPASKLLDPSNDAVEIPTDNRYQIASQLEQFTSKIGQSFLNQFRTLCLNRSRVRRTLCHAAVEWDQIQADAEDIDTQMQALIGEQPQPYPSDEDLTFSYPLSSWIYHYKLVQLRLIIQMGFELSIYASHEYAQSYWYLGHICNIHLAHLERISYFVSRQEGLATSPDPQTSHKAVERALRHLNRHFSLLKATEAQAKSLHRIYCLLQRQGHFAKVFPAYASKKLRFELRMRPFQHLSIPEPLGFEEMHNLSDLKQCSDQELLNQALRLSLTAKKTWEEVLKSDWHAEPLNAHEEVSSDEGTKNLSVIGNGWQTDIRNCMRACIGTNITISTLAKSVQSGSKDGKGGTTGSFVASIPEPGERERFHSWWAVPKISM